MAAQQVLLALSGGVALGAYQAGAYASLHEHLDLHPQRLTGSSIGAVNAAIIAGGPVERRVERLRDFWSLAAIEPGLNEAFLPPFFWGHAHNWLSALQTRLFGHPRLFQPRLPELMLKKTTGIYDLALLRARIEDIVDFGWLNSGEVRLSVVATDIETGEEAIFDTHKGDRIGPDHLLASCGFLPEFAPVEIGGRLLGDGGFAANAPIAAALLDEESGGDILVFAIDLFCPEGGRPTTLEEAAARRWDLIFGGQSRQQLKSLEREHRLRWALGHLAAKLGPDAAMDPELAAILGEGSQRTVKLLYLSYLAPSEEAGSEKSFDFSRAALRRRWEAGALDMAEAIRLAREGNGARCESGISVRRVRR